MHDQLTQAKIKQAEAKIVTLTIKRNAAEKALSAAGARGAGPDRRKKLIDAYDLSEERLMKAEDDLRALRRKSMGLTPTVAVGDVIAAYKATS